MKRWAYWKHIQVNDYKLLNDITVLGYSSLVHYTVNLTTSTEFKGESQMHLVSVLTLDYVFLQSFISVMLTWIYMPCFTLPIVKSQMYLELRLDFSLYSWKTWNWHILPVVQHVLLTIRQMILCMESHLNFQVDSRYLQWFICQVTDKLMAVFSFYSTLISLLWWGKKLLWFCSVLEECLSCTDLMCHLYKLQKTS